MNQRVDVKRFFRTAPVVISHRGASFCEPENTLRSFERAVEMGSRAIEFDVRKSLDDQLVVIHDSKVDRTTDGRGAVGSKTLSDLKSLDAGGGQRIPTLEEVLESFAGRCGLVIELKEEGTEEKTVELIKKHGLADDVIVVSFRKNCIRSVRAIAPGVATGLITVFGLGCVREAFALGCRAVAANHLFMRREIVSESEKTGLFSCCWTVNDVRRAEKLAAMGVGGLITDFPDILER